MGTTYIYLTKLKIPERVFLITQCILYLTNKYISNTIYSSALHQTNRFYAILQLEVKEMIKILVVAIVGLVLAVILGPLNSDLVANLNAGMVNPDAVAITGKMLLMAAISIAVTVIYVVGAFMWLVQET